MKKLFKGLLSVLAVLVFFSCDDVFEENITDDLITVIFPIDNEEITGNSVAFKWNELEGVDGYRLQVLKTSSQEVVVDSLFSTSNLVLPLATGEYDWRVRGENFAYQTAYSFPESFSVESTNDLSSQSVFLNSPTDDFYTKNNTVILNWAELVSAQTYVLQVDKTISSNSSIVLQETDIVTNGFVLDNTVLSEDAIYVWGVQAVNDNSQTAFSTRRILLDTRVPNIPILISPNNNGNVSSTVEFSWNIGLDTGEIKSPISSILEIASNQDFTSLTQSYTLSGSIQSHTFDTVGQYYWRVKLFDEAGNESDYSESREITVE